MAFAITDKVFAAQTVLREVADQHGNRAVFTTAFGLEGSVILHMIARSCLPIRIVTLDTGLFFAQTYATWTRLAEQLQLKIEGMVPALSLDEQAQQHGSELWRTHPNICCSIRKVQPLKQLLGDADAWITGIRRDQTPERANAPRVGHEARFNVVKVNPLVDWSIDEVRAYLGEHEVPYNPMFDDGYPSIGCTPCTQRVEMNADPRSGRWSGSEKRECGLHWDHEAASADPIHLGRTDASLESV